MIKSILGVIAVMSILLTFFLGVGYVVNCAINATFLLQNMAYEGRSCTVCICCFLTLCFSIAFFIQKIDLG